MDKAHIIIIGCIQEYRQVDPETARAILELMDVRDPEDKLNKCENAEGGYDMCQAIEEIMEDGRIEGRAEGRAEGLAEGRTEGLTEGRAEGRVEGRASTLVRNIECAMRNFHVNLQVACENLGTTVEEYHKAKKIVEAG